MRTIHAPDASELDNDSTQQRCSDPDVRWRRPRRETVAFGNLRPRPGLFPLGSRLGFEWEQDLIVFYYTGRNGLAPPTGLTMLMIDKDGRPVPWDVVGYFEQDSRGIRDLLDLNHDGHTELIQRRFDDGYWSTSAYETSDSHWRRVDGRLGSRVFPLYTRFTTRPNHQATLPGPGRSPFNPDFSNVLSEAALTTVRKFSYSGLKLDPKYYPPDRLDPVYCCDSMTLVLEDGRGCGPLHFWPTVVVDRPRTRDFGLLNGPSVPLLEEVSHDHRPVWVVGQAEKAKCSPVLIWAAARNN